MNELQMLPLPLLDWYFKNARTLPWRSEPTPYRVWISEIMLQQTRIEAGKGYFLRWMKELPDAASLAEVSDERLMKLWEGLGYYNRARNLKKAAEIIVDRFGGDLPGDYNDLLSLPGIGSYTAGAIGSIAFGLPVPAVDGNVLRVLARLRADKSDISSSSVKKAAETELRTLLEENAGTEEFYPGDFNQALMELGALVCIPNGAPKCGQCPAASFCRAYLQGLTGCIPVKAAKKERRIEKKTVFLIRTGSRFVLHKRDKKGLLAGLWELPNAEGHLSSTEARSWLCEHAAELPALSKAQLQSCSLEPLPESTHIFSHVEWHMKGFEICAEEPPFLYESTEAYEAAELPQKYALIRSDELKSAYSLPSAFRAYRKLL